MNRGVAPGEVAFWERAKVGAEEAAASNRRRNLFDVEAVAKKRACLGNATGLLDDGFSFVLAGLFDEAREAFAGAGALARMAIMIDDRWHYEEKTGVFARYAASSIIADADWALRTESESSSRIAAAEAFKDTLRRDARRRSWTAVFREPELTARLALYMGAAEMWNRVAELNSPLAPTKSGKVWRKVLELLRLAGQLKAGEADETKVSSKWKAELRSWISWELGHKGIDEAFQYSEIVKLLLICSRLFGGPEEPFGVIGLIRRPEWLEN